MLESGIVNKQIKERKDKQMVYMVNVRGLAPYYTNEKRKADNLLAWYKVNGWKTCNIEKISDKAFRRRIVSKRNGVYTF